MPSSRPLIAPVLAVPAPTLLFKNSRDAEDCLRGGMRLDLAGALAYLCLRLGHDRLNIEVIKTGLDALAGIRPLLLGHMRPGIPHPSAVSDGAVMQVRLWAERRPLRVFSWGHRA